MTANSMRRLCMSLRTLAGAVVLGIAACAVSAVAQEAPLLKVLDQFSAADVPALGPGEAGPTTRSWAEPSSSPVDLPGKGLAQHPMLYAGEGYNTIFLVNHGKVVWTYSSGR